MEYGLKLDDPRAARAGKALVAVNPHLTGNLAALPAGTPVVVAVIPGLNATGSAIIDPKRAAWMNVLDKLVDSAQQASNAQQTGVATASPKTPNPQRTQALALLQNDIAKFRKIH